MSIEQSEQITALSKALVAFQGQVSGASKGGANPHFRSSYTRLEDAWKAAREALTSCGLSVTQWPTTDEGRVSVTTRVMHESGEWMQSTLSIDADVQKGRSPAQACGSAITYACRYAFMAALGLPPTDDDAESTRAKPKAAPVGDPEDFEIPFGKNAGKTFRELATNQVSWYAKEAKNREVKNAAQRVMEARKRDRSEVDVGAKLQAERDEDGDHNDAWGLTPPDPATDDSLLEHPPPNE